MKEKRSYFWSLASPKIGVSPFFAKSEHFRVYNVVHNSNINVAIAHILMGLNKLNDCQGQSYKIQ
jgi:hypothetical protein